MTVQLVMTVFHAMDDRPSRHEQQGFEECVRDKMKHTGRVRTNAQRGNHIAQLTDSGKGQDALDVSLRQGNNRSIDRCNGPHNGQHRHRL